MSAKMVLFANVKVSILILACKASKPGLDTKLRHAL